MTWRARSLAACVTIMLAAGSVLSLSLVMAPSASATTNLCEAYQGFVWQTEQDMADATGEYCRSTWLLDPGVGNLIDRNFLVRAGSKLFTAKGFSKNFLWYAPYQRITIPADSAQKWVTCVPGIHDTGYNGLPACAPSDVVTDTNTISYDFGYQAVTLHTYTYDGNFITAVCGNYNTPLTKPNGTVPYPIPVIDGNVFNDLNKNGARDSGESGLAGWNITLTRDSSLYGDQTAGWSETTTTDSHGNYHFRLDGIGPGTYTVTEGSRQYWHPTNRTSQTVVVDAGHGNKTYNVTPFGDWLNQAPKAVIAPVSPVDQTSAAGASVTFDGTASHDPDGDSLSYTWTGPFPGPVSGATPTVTLPAGTSTVTLTVSDGERSSSATTTVTVYPPITALPGSLSGTEGFTITGTDATFADPDPTATASQYTATIDWGDGTAVTTNAAITKMPDGSFTVSAPHTYTDEGAYNATVTITDTDNSFNTATVTTPIAVADAPLQATGTKTATTNPLSGYPVATFTDGNPGATTADFTASIDWGDGVTSVGTVTGPLGGPFTVAGSHDYASLGLYTVTVNITDDGGSTATATSQIMIFAYPAGGNFVIGDGSSGTLAAGPVANGAAVTFWGYLWSTDNSLTSGPAPAAFEGFDDSPATPVIGGTWLTDPGNSSAPPPLVPEYMAVIVSGKIAMAGSAITGDVTHVVIVRTNPGYASDPGHPGTGTIIWDLG